MNALMPSMGQPQAAPQGPSAEMVAAAHDQMEVIIAGLLKLISKPMGQLTKADVFKAAADMIAKGAFPDPEHKQQLVAQLVQLPDAEPALRKALGALLMQYAAMQEHVTAMHGPKGQPHGA